MNMIKTDDGDGHTDEKTVDISGVPPTPTVSPTATATSTPKPPSFEAVFANFSFQKEKFIKENMVLLVKFFFLRKGLQSHTSC
jgi:hypothetical protein